MEAITPGVQGIWDELKANHEESIEETEQWIEQARLNGNEGAFHQWEARLARLRATKMPWEAE